MNAIGLVLREPEMCGVPDYLKDQNRTLEKALADMKEAPSESR